MLTPEGLGMSRYTVALVRTIELERFVTIETDDSDDAWTQAYNLSAEASDATFAEVHRDSVVAWVEEAE